MYYVFYYLFIMHRSYYVDAAYYYRRSSVAFLSVRLSVLQKNGWTERDAVWVMDLGGPKERCIRWSSCEGAILMVKQAAHC